jgi:hypothetical protein
VAGSAALLVGLAAAGARADTGVVCGSTITSDATLDSDLSCAGAGVVVVSARLDLNGHSVLGSGVGTGVTLQGTDATVVSGSVSGFADGVGMGGQDPLVRSLTVSGNTNRGILLFTGRTRTNDAEIDTSTITGNGGDGVEVADAHGTIVDGSVITYNGGSGIDAELQADAGDYFQNTITDNSGYGIYAFSSTSHATENTVSRNGRAGIYFYEDATPLAAGGYLIASNTANQNGGVGISACVLDQANGNPCAPGMIDGGGNVAADNDSGTNCININCAQRR